MDYLQKSHIEHEYRTVYGFYYKFCVLPKLQLRCYRAADMSHKNHEGVARGGFCRLYGIVFSIIILKSCNCDVVYFI